MEISYHALFGVAATVVGMVSVVPYLKSIVSGTTRPHFYSQTGWALLSALPAAAMFAQGPDWPIVVPLIFTLNALLVIGTAWYTKKFAWAYSHFDTIAYAFGISAIGAWVISNDPIMAIYLAIAGDVLFTLPTITKTIRDPASEAFLPWLLITFSALLGLLAVSSFELHNVAYPLYAVFGTGIIAMLASRTYWKRT